jgi:hypothetical protein
MVKVIFVVMVAVLVVIPMFVSCTPSIQTPPLIAVDDKSEQDPSADDYSIAKTRIVSLESELANCQSININLQKQIDQSASASDTLTAKEPVSGDTGSYNMIGDKPGMQYPNKYLVWDINSMSCGYSQEVNGFGGNNCRLMSTVKNNHPTLAITDVTINGDSIGSTGTNATINPGEAFTNTKNLPIPKVVDYQVTLRWVWK